MAWKPKAQAFNWKWILEEKRMTVLICLRSFPLNRRLLLWYFKYFTNLFFPLFCILCLRYGIIVNMVTKVVHTDNMVGRCISLRGALSPSYIWAFVVFLPAEDAVNFATVRVFLFACCSCTCLRWHDAKAPCPLWQREVLYEECW